MDRPTIYIETSIVSYLAAHPSRDPVTLRNQQLTHAWWNEHRHEFSLLTSPLTWVESARGDAETVRRRLELLATVPACGWPTESMRLARMLQVGIPLPERARADAQHMALAAMNQLAYLLTWDRKHIANPRLRHRIERILRTHGYSPPVFCTPEELMR